MHFFLNDTTVFISINVGRMDLYVDITSCHLPVFVLNQGGFYVITELNAQLDPSMVRCAPNEYSCQPRHAEMLQKLRTQGHNIPAWIEVVHHLRYTKSNRHGMRALASYVRDVVRSRYIMII